MKQTESLYNPAVTADLKADCMHELVMGVGNECTGSQVLKEFAVCKEHRNLLITLHRVNRGSVTEALSVSILLTCTCLTFLCVSGFSFVTIKVSPQRGCA